MEKPYVKFGAYVKELRESKKLTLKQVSEALGFKSTQALSLIENGSVLLQPRYQIKFCRMFGIPLMEIRLKIERLMWLRDIQMARRQRKKLKD